MIKEGTARTSLMGRRYVMRKIVSAEELVDYIKFKLSCGHEEMRWKRPDIKVKLFIFLNKETKDKALLGCFECGRIERERRGLNL